MTKQISIFAEEEVGGERDQPQIGKRTRRMYPMDIFRRKEGLVRVDETDRQLRDDWLRMRRRMELLDKPASCRYIPSGAAERTIRFVGSGKVRKLLLPCGNGFGKSSLVCVMLDQLINGVNNPWFDYPIFHNFPFPRKIAIIGTPSSIADDGGFKEEFNNWVRQEGMYKNKKGKNYYCHYEKNGWTITVFSQDQDPKEIESPTYGLIMPDEPMTLEFFNAFASRTRKGALWLMTGTPLRGAGYLIDKVVNKADLVLKNHVMKDNYQEVMAETDRQIKALPERATVVAQGCVWENCVEQGYRGVLYEADIEDMIKDYDEDQKRARIWGEFMYYAGLLIKSYKPKVEEIKDENYGRCRHLLTDFEDFPILRQSEGRIPGHWPKGCVIDPAVRRPPVLLYFAVDEAGRNFIFKEWPPKGKYKWYEEEGDMREEYWDDLWDFMQSLEREVRWDGGNNPNSFKPIKYIMDPRGKDQSNKFRKGTYWELFRDAGFRCSVLTRTEQTFGIQQVNLYFKQDKLFVFGDCLQTDHAFQRCVWDEHRGRTAEGKMSKEKARELGKDHVDCTRYWLLRKPEQAVADYVTAEKNRVKQAKYYRLAGERGKGFFRSGGYGM